MTGRNAPTPRTLRALLILLRTRICPYIGIDMSGKNLSERLLLELAPIFMCANVFARSRYEWARDNDLLSEGLYTLPAPHGDTFREMIDCPAVLARLPWCGKKRLLVTSCIVTKQNEAIICQDRLGTHIVLKQLVKRLRFRRIMGAGFTQAGMPGVRTLQKGNGRQLIHAGLNESHKEYLPAPFNAF